MNFLIQLSDLFPVRFRRQTMKTRLDHRQRLELQQHLTTVQRFRFIQWEIFSILIHWIRIV